MNITIGKKEYELKYTFNSFRYMQELDFGKMQELSNKPFMMVGMLELMFYGALNHNPKKYYSEEVSLDLLEKVMETHDIMELFEGLTTMLTEHDFFKKLQK